MKKLSKKTITIIVAVAVIAVYLVSAYNGLVGQDESVSTAWSNVETQYQRRSDLIPNLVNTVKGYAKHEQSTLREVVEARAQATSIKVDAQNLTPEKLKEFQQAQGQVAGALGKLFAVAESYPDLKANENFADLQAQLEGTENRITESRRVYNETVQSYNRAVRRFPGNIVARMFGFSTKSKFEAESGSEKAPTVSFD